MKIVIVEDERPARSELKYLLEQCRPEWKLIEASNCEEMMQVMEKEHPDGGFVDIQLGDMNGTTLASMLLNKKSGICIGICNRISGVCSKGI